MLSYKPRNLREVVEYQKQQRRNILHVYRRYSRVEYETFERIEVAFKFVEAGKISIPQFLLWLESNKRAAQRKAFSEKNNKELLIIQGKRGNPRKSDQKWIAEMTWPLD